MGPKGPGTPDPAGSGVRETLGGGFSGEYPEPPSRARGQGASFGVLSVGLGLPGPTGIAGGWQAAGPHCGPRHVLGRFHPCGTSGGRVWDTGVGILVRWHPTFLKWVEASTPVGGAAPWSIGAAEGTSWPWWSISRQTKTWTWYVASSCGSSVSWPPAEGCIPLCCGISTPTQAGRWDSGWPR